MDASRVEVVLVRPARPANVAAACRALKNMGLGRLTLVEPPPGLDEPEARSLAYGAWDVLDARRNAGSLLEAVSECTLVAGTTGRERPDAWTPRRLAAEADERAGPGRLAVVFGPESRGLSNEELALCHVQVHIPTSPVHSSLNLAQAVLIVAYEIHLAGPAGSDAGRPSPATAGELEQAILDLRGALLEVGYLNPASPDDVLHELRGLIARAAPTGREVTLLRGLARQVAWAGRKACAGRRIG
jgi:TrmH family RNA methyltransferase